MSQASTNFLSLICWKEHLWSFCVKRFISVPRNNSDKLPKGVSNYCRIMFHKNDFSNTFVKEVCLNRHQLHWKIFKITLENNRFDSSIVYWIFWHDKCGYHLLFKEHFTVSHCVAFIYLLTYLLTYSMVQSPSWEANWFAASQEIPRILWNPKDHYRTHKPPSPVPILGQPNPVHIATSHVLEIHPDIIHPSTPRSPQWSLSLRFPNQDPIHPLSSPIRATCPAHLILLDFITRTLLGEEYKSFSSSLCNLLHTRT